MSKIRPMGSWQSLEYTIEQAQEIMKEHEWSVLPGSTVLKNNGYCSFLAAVHKYHGGIRKFREILEQNPSEQKETGYWKKWENVQKELEEIIEELWHFPSQRELNKLGKSSLNNGIENFGGFRAIRKKIGYEQIMKPKNYWRSHNNIITELKKIMEEHGFEKVPNQIQLRNLGYQTLITAINKYHEGLNKIRIDFGEEISTVLVGQWKDLEFTIEQAKKAMEKEGWKILPGSTTLYRHGYSGLSTAISIYHGGIRYFREKILGQEQIIEKVGKLKDINYCMNRVQNIMVENNFTTLPSSKTFTKIGQSSVAAAISKYHGGFPAFREILMQHITGKSSKEQLEDLLKEYVGEN